ncbi:MAG: NAD(P)/FAD-dependent oxidoreductase [Methanothrix sp.]|nr:MAG: NAD(P)/FAD-dependent oxidoreductase [Methanothrix sp.]
MKCDVLVIGASAAGLCAATAAANGDAGVILLDKDFDHPKHTANTLFDGMAARAGLQIDDCYVQRELDGMRIISPAGHGVTIPARGYFIDRQRFDRHYLDIAEKSGVMLLSGEAQNAKLDGSRRTVMTGSSTEEIDARIVVDASGIKAVPARQAGLQPMRHPEDIAWAMEVEVEHPGLGDEMFFQYWIGSMAPGWKATFSPAGGERATLGVFVRGHGQNVQSFFRSFLQKFKAYKAQEYKDIEEMKILSVTRGGDPICVLPGQIVADSFMVTGGAAGQSGLAYGMRAGTICGSVAAEATAEGDVSSRSLSDYGRQWNSEFFWEYCMGRAALETLQNLKDEEVDRLCRSLSGKTLISDGSFLKKAAYSGAKVALARPSTIFDLVMNLARS